jgi:DUF1009 family protein
MAENQILVELQFDQLAGDVYEHSAKSLSALDVERGGVARDPSIVAALTVAAAATHLITELIKLANELRAMGKQKGVSAVKLDKNNKAKELALLEASESEIEKFISGD